MLSVNSIDSAISALFGPSVKVVDRQRVSGRDINCAYKLELSSGECVFLKGNRAGLLDMFTAETSGLEALRATGTIGVPEPMAVGADETESFLIMEYLAPAPRRYDYWETFGRELAMLHRAKCGPCFGFPTDDYIGSTPQQYTPSDSWVSFFRVRRLLPQIKHAWSLLDERTRRNLTRITERLDALLPKPAFPTLIHGDLWSGNAVCGPDGKAWILDPATYVGHFEAELTMTKLFGGFPERFYLAYNAVNPIDRGYETAATSTTSTTFSTTSTFSASPIFPMSRPSQIVTPDPPYFAYTVANFDRTPTKYTSIIIGTLNLFTSELFDYFCDLLLHIARERAR